MDNKEVAPRVYLVARPDIDWSEVYRYLDEEVGGGHKWWARRHGAGIPGGEFLAELAGRFCYRSWEPGLNPNVTKVREDRAKYLENILDSGHGSVLEHASYTFILANVSRVMTHEVIRHRAGTAVSQESMRFVRLDEIPFWFPDWAKEDEYVMGESRMLLRAMEVYQERMAEHFNLDQPGTPFPVKKAKTSFMRRLAPEGVATGMVFTANIRALRHIIEVRTDEHAEEEIREVAGQICVLMRKECPLLFGDYVEVHPGGNPVWPKKWTTRYRKV